MNNAFWPEFHQVAMYTGRHDEALAMLKACGYTEWSHDEALLLGVTSEGTCVTRGRMSFNYQFLGGKELELLTYEGDSHHHRAGRVIPGAEGPCECHPPFISHMSVHVEHVFRRALDIVAATGCPIVHAFETFNHVNPEIKGRKRFREVIIGTREVLGYDMKLIERVLIGPWRVSDEQVELYRQGFSIPQMDVLDSWLQRLAPAMLL